MNLSYHTSYPGIDDLREAARRRTPRFAFEYLDGGCNEDVNLLKNTDDLRQVELKPYYLTRHEAPVLKTELFGHEYDAPFGIAPIGLQGLIWPGSPEILARAATEHNVPFILSTVTTASIERIGEITGGRFWYQLYHPADNAIRDDILNRAEAAGCKTLVLLCDVPTFGYRPRDIRNGLAMPPRMTLRNILQIVGRPNWAVRTLLHGKPHFATMAKYMPKGLNMKQLGAYMNATFSGRLNEAKIAPIRDRWKGNLVLKGVASEEDTETAVRLGLDGIIVSNHGGRQVDAGESTIRSLLPIAAKYRSKLRVMIDSGLRTGPDIARALACDADFTFLGRTFMYAVAALGREGGQHAIAMLKVQLKQVMDQVCCHRVADFRRHLLRKPD
ncbi:L-lactate dehydrogenase [cytochrome] [Gemmata obscuriglobus]|uniref:Alpha-hydroxy-acid oxidizing protein n=1 Tax=Gemmata obscuriglobus TaxID=114 RepID=A0A2Z3GZX2_9BACT|nr:alpha-hydroxy acid oxidase [Gemmata obscuriglobus]AWM36415.1 alpha-hydroxy-acid oxidizing protein [Gemmata obscuriglobus]QEG30968.1 L-lactate dehydrogenase [cytochrome] [Gemmata obscuriglobus]VTS10301.1 l-lactate dehydrogenase : L-lactate dehydrogenase (Cytochrome) OS=Runella slithyformis (strain ATCC 29530 / DSM 19594 / LMG 11500 / NCIMB 11436 / LSU 4) GN=Runsl_3317 PE=4 SV=1: FMN_dh [Gemmata obscuriglobus UQM 2246]